jgi:peroxidase family protein
VKSELILSVTGFKFPPSGFSGFPRPTPTPVPPAVPKPSPPAPASSAPAAAPPAASPAAGGACPQVWFKISADLKGTFTAGAPSGQCNDLARLAIRAAFHDCGSWNQTMGTSAGCDGSLYLAKEYTRSENAGLEQGVPVLGAMAQTYGVGVADFFQFAGGELIHSEWLLEKHT